MSIESPYTDPQVTFTDEDQVNEVELLDEKSQQLKDINELYSNKKSILDNILKLYKFLSLKEEQQLWEKTQDDVQSDIAVSSYAIDMSNSTKGPVLTDEERDKLILKKYTVVPILIDFCFIYYIKMNDNDKLYFYTMPTTLLKLKFVCATMGCKDIAINGIFEDIVQNQLFKDMRSTVPFHLVTDLSPDELKSKLYDEVLPIMKNLVDKILRLK